MYPGLRPLYGLAQLVWQIVVRPPLIIHIYKAIISCSFTEVSRHCSCCKAQGRVQYNSVQLCSPIILSGLELIDIISKTCFRTAE